MGFWWHKQPAAGSYCIYRKRSTENVSSCGLPNCPNIAQTLARHAKMLTDVGVDVSRCPCRPPRRHRHHCR
jgi:hypothetical protein